jgi:hypothetical protein
MIGYWGCSTEGGRVFDYIAEIPFDDGGIEFDAR